MAQPYVGEIRIFAGNFPPVGWLFCDGQLLAIAENETLFQLIGTTYGGDGESTFALPNLQSRIPIHQGTGPFGTTYTLAEMAGVEEVTLTVQQMPNHNHALLASQDPGTEISPAGGVLAAGGGVNIFRPGPGVSPMNAQAVVPAGASQPHDNMHPFICINYIISLFGLFPRPT